MNIKNSYFQGKRIRFSDEGEGEVLLLLHGFIERIEIWENFSQELSKQFRVVCIELPGHGESEVIAPVQTMELMADMVYEILQKNQIHHIVLVGHSMGGYVGLAFAEKYPEMIKGLGLFHSQVLADTTKAKLGRERAIEIIKLNKEGFIFNFISDLFAECNRETFKEEIKQLQEGAKTLSGEALVACLQGMKERTDKLVLLMDIDVPMMFIAGKEDTRASIHDIIAQSIIPNHSEILVLGDCGHMGYIEKRKETMNFVAQFVKTCFTE